MKRRSRSSSHFVVGDHIIMISRNRVKQGMFQEFARHYQESIPAVEANKPGTLSQVAYTNEEGTEAIILRIFENAQAMDEHLEGADQRSTVTYQFIEPTQVEVYGSPSTAGMEMIQDVVGPGVDVHLYTGEIAGLVRTESL